MIRRTVLFAALALAAGPAFANEGGEKKKGGGKTFLQIKPITVTVIRRDGRRGVLTVECGVDVPDDRLRERADASQPRLRAGYAQLIQIYAAGLPNGAAPDADYLAREMQRETDRVLGKPGARLLVGTILVS